MKFRDATREDFRTFYGIDPPFSVRAAVAEKNGEIVGFGGYYIRDGVAIAFTDRKGDLTRREVVLCGRRMRELLARLNVNMWAMCGADGDTALRHFGFEPDGEAYRMVR
jgi:hypothetical protein